MDGNIHVHTDSEYVSAAFKLGVSVSAAATSKKVGAESLSWATSIARVTRRRPHVFNSKRHHVALNHLDAIVLRPTRGFATSSG